MTKRIFASALFAGLAAGLVAAALQLWLIVPLILQGELYESGAQVHFTDGAAQSAARMTGIGGDLSRHAMTVGMNVVAFTAFGLLMVAGFAIAGLRGRPVSARAGVIWGLAGFLGFALAPSVGLPPELPGTIGAALGSRQLWWGLTVICSLSGLGLIAWAGRWPGVLAGVALILLPHLIGAPRIDTYFGVAPPELASLFVARSLAVSAASWAFLGTVAAWFWTGAGRDAKAVDNIRI